MVMENKKINYNLLILSDLMNVCEKISEIRPVVLFGSLLGIIRDGDLISWNNDIELGVSQFEWNETEIEKVCNRMRSKGYIVNYYRLNKAISIRTNNNFGEVHINYFKELNGYCYRPLEPSNLKFTNLFSFVFYFTAILLSADLDKRNNHNIKKLFYYMNCVIPEKVRKIISRYIINTSLFFTSRKGTYEFPFQLYELKDSDLHGIKIFIPRKSKLVVQDIYGKEWRTPIVDWSYYDPKNAHLTKVKKLIDKWDYKYLK